ncbi:MAG: hypothetical protein PHE70_10650 [Tepidanaerobacteraceae bacterium]|nr:hypothetical protein [Tepidanaerobacteraceae bacterium]
MKKVICVVISILVLIFLLASCDAMGNGRTAISKSSGESKGLTFERVLIFPTKPILDWMKDHSKTLKDQSQSKFYVALTRAKHSVAVVCDFSNKAIYPDIQKHIKEANQVGDGCM